MKFINDKISIIVSIYNGELTLNKCLESIRHQSYNNFEVLLINDGSTDKSEEICKKIEKEDSRFKYFYKDNGGVSSARNFGLDLVGGKYVCFLDCDDWLDIDFLSMCITNLIKTNSDISAVKFNLVDDTNKIVKKHLHNNYIIMNKYEALIKLVNGTGFSSGCTNKLYKHNIIKHIRFKKITVAEDLNFNYEILKRNNKLKIVFSDCALYNYYISSSNSITHGNFSKKNLEVIKQYDYLINDSIENFPEFSDALKKSYVFIIIKILLKMVASSYYDEKIVIEGINKIKLYKNMVIKSSDYSLFKKIFLIVFIKNSNSIMNSYNKNNIWKKIALYLNKKVG